MVVKTPVDFKSRILGGADVPSAMHACSFSGLLTAPLVLSEFLDAKTVYMLLVYTGYHPNEIQTYE
jgi:hypothetical protein